MSKLKGELREYPVPHSYNVRDNQQWPLFRLPDKRLVDALLSIARRDIGAPIVRCGRQHSCGKRRQRQQQSERCQLRRRRRRRRRRRQGRDGTRATMHGPRCMRATRTCRHKSRAYYIAARREATQRAPQRALSRGKLKKEALLNAKADCDLYPRATKSSLSPCPSTSSLMLVRSIAG